MTERQPKPDTGFVFTERERVLQFLHTTRLLTLLQPPTVIHKTHLSSNQYGEFLFITASRTTSGGTECLTFYGMGLHDYRDRWYVDEWKWYTGYLTADLRQQHLAMADLQTLLDQRRADIADDVAAHQPSRDGQLFEMLADLTDDDGALAEMQDLGLLWHSLTGDDGDEIDE